MRALTPREKLLVAVLPALCLGACYVWGFREGFVTRRIAAPRARLAQLEARAQERSPDALTRLRRSVDDLEARRDELQARLDGLARRWFLPARRAAAVARVGEELENSGLALLHSYSDREAQDRPALPPPLVRLAQRMKRAGCAEPELWRFELEGDYAALLEALARLSRLPEEEVFCLPVTLALTRVDAGGRGASALALTLWVWI